MRIRPQLRADAVGARVKIAVGAMVFGRVDRLE